MLSTSKAIRAMMMREGATFHKCVETAEMAHMGGGMGIGATENIKANTVLATIPPNCMLTTSKCRYHLALIEQYVSELLHPECQIEEKEEKKLQIETKEVKEEQKESGCDATTENVEANDGTGKKEQCVKEVCTCIDNICNDKLQLQNKVLYFPANELTEEEKRQQLGDHWYTRVHLVEEQLHKTLSPAETITCYLVLMAALYNRPIDAKMTFTSTSKASTESPRYAEQASETYKTCTIRFTHENKWMRLWILSLPSSCDNLLELPMFDSDCNNTSIKNNNNCNVDENNMQVSEAGVDNSKADKCGKVLPSPFLFARQAAKVKEEQLKLYKSFVKCKNSLHCLSHLPFGEDVGHYDFRENSSLSLPAEVKTMINKYTQIRGDANDANNKKEEYTETMTEKELMQRTCTYEMFIWAFNMLMSRGFSYSKEVWAMMPWVDYFNYNRYGNCTMYECKHILPNENANTEKEEENKVCFSDDYATCTVCVDNNTINNKCYQFISTEPICQGSELTISYGAYSDFELLLWYGFNIRESLLLFVQCTEIYKKIIEEFGLKIYKEELHENDIERKVEWREYSGYGNTELEKSLAAFLSIFTDQEYSVKRLADISRCKSALSEMPWQKVYENYIETVKAKKICWQEKSGNDTDVSKNNSNTGQQRNTVVNMEQRVNEFKSSVISFDDWCTAVNHAFSVPLSPLADADGNYLDQTLNNNWIEELCQSYSKKTDEEVLKQWKEHYKIFVVELNQHSRIFVAMWNSKSAKDKAKLLPYLLKCNICLGKQSENMMVVLKTLAWWLHSYVKNKGRALKEISKVNERWTAQISKYSVGWILRVFAWMELQSCHRTLMAHAINSDLANKVATNYQKCNVTYKSNPVYKAAATVSVDNYVLLYCLAFQISNKKLVRWLYKSEHDYYL